MSFSNQNIRVRIAPSPTGPLHVGTARTALVNYLFAKKNKGKFILRIEDTDLERSDPKYEKDIVENLKWLGLECDEGPDTGGKLGPYRQSERIDSYQKYIEKLLKNGQAFYCFHSENELESEKTAQIKAKKAQRHVCGHFEKKPKIGPKMERGREQGIIRFRPPAKKLKFKDLIRGEIEFDTELLGDISIAKNPTTPLYNFAVVVDDYEMKISHIIRGEDHISNTPKQILIQEALDLPRPEYVHIPLTLGPDRTKLSKRHGALSISWYREQGYLSEALLNFMALLGWNPGTEKEIFSMEELIKEFSLERVQKGGAIFDLTKLDWINGYYIRDLDIDILTEKCIPFLNEKLKIKNEKRQSKIKNYEIKETGEVVGFDYLKKIVGLEQERMKKLSEIGELADFFFKDHLKYDKNLLRCKEMGDKEVLDILDKLEKILSGIDSKDFTEENLRKILMAEAERVGDIGKLFWPLRVALTGKKASPDPIDIAVVLGREKVLNRVKDAKKLMGQLSMKN